MKIIDQERVFERTEDVSFDLAGLSCHVDGIFSFQNWKQREQNLYELVSESVLYEGKTAFEMAFRKKWDVE